MQHRTLLAHGFALYRVPADVKFEYVYSQITGNQIPYLTWNERVCAQGHIQMSLFTDGNVVLEWCIRKKLILEFSVFQERDRYGLFQSINFTRHKSVGEATHELSFSPRTNLLRPGVKIIPLSRVPACQLEVSPLSEQYTAPIITFPVKNR